MPIKWDLEAKYKLLLMIVAQQPTILSSKIDHQAISESWVRNNEELTVRAAQEQVKSFRKEIANFGTSSVSTTQRRTAATPRRTTTPITTSSKRNARGAASSSLNAKRRRTKTLESEESACMTEESQMEASSDEESGHVKPITPSRNQPARAKRQQQSYVTPSDSAMVDAGANASASDASYEEVGGEPQGRALGLYSGQESTNKSMCNDREMKLRPEEDTMGGTITRRTSFVTASEEI